MNFFLSLQIITMKDFLITVLAAEWLVIGVDSLLSFNIPYIQNAVIVLAAEWYLNSVDFFISLHITWCLEHFDKLGSVECFFTIKKSLMWL